MPNPMDRTVSLVLNGNRPLSERVQLLMNAFNSAETPQEDKQAILTKLLEAQTRPADYADYLEKCAAVDNLIRELEAGPVQPATFIEPSGSRVQVVSFDGQRRFPVLAPDLKADTIKPGETVYLDAKGMILLEKTGRMPQAGPEANYLRTLPNQDDLIEVQWEEHLVVLHTSQILRDKIKAGELKRGDKILICPRREFGFLSIPCEQDRSYRFIDNSQIPDIEINRDIGSPHWILDYLITRTRTIMFDPEFMQQFEMRPRVAALLSGPSGTGKTLSIKGFLRQFVKMLEERTGLPQKKSRVVRAKVSELLSEWLGRSDKNIDQLFDDLYSIVSEKVKTANGEEIHLPVVLILEEAEGFARRRGDMDSGIYDRILGTMLQRLDDPTEDLSKFPLIIITTTNRPDLFDAAMWRRLSGVHASFGRLDREGFQAVLEKKLKPHFPYDSSKNGEMSPREHIISDITEQIYGQQAQPVISLKLRDGREVPRYGKHFMTGAVVEQVVSNTIDQIAIRRQKGQSGTIHITHEMLSHGFYDYIGNVAKNLKPQNVSDYIDLPAEVAVTQVQCHS